MAVGMDLLCVDCDGPLTVLNPLDRIMTCDEEVICRRCLNKRKIRICMMDEDLPYPSLIVGSLGLNRTANEAMEALRLEQGSLVLELFSEGL